MSHSATLTFENTLFNTIFQALTDIKTYRVIYQNVGNVLRKKKDKSQDLQDSA